LPVSTGAPEIQEFSHAEVVAGGFFARNYRNGRSLARSEDPGRLPIRINHAAQVSFSEKSRLTAKKRR
jgi:hypothetical protein